MTQIHTVQKWISTAKQERNPRNTANYLAYMLSEAGEGLKEIEDCECQKIAHFLEVISKRIRSGALDEKIQEANQAKLMDAAFDTAWTAFGLMHMLGDAVKAWQIGADSNYSKFVDGVAELTPDGKVIKGPNFHEPDFRKAL